MRKCSESLIVSQGDLRRFCDKLWDFQKTVMQYHKVQYLIQKLQHQVQTFIQKEYHMRVELVVDDLSFDL